MTIYDSLEAADNAWLETEFILDGVIQCDNPEYTGLEEAITPPVSFAPSNNKKIIWPTKKTQTRHEEALVY